jgi:KaiC/GvpD/RAD55 family RecA-like ATPase
MQKVGDILQKYKLDDTDKYVSREFQKYAYDLAEELGDMAHKSLYMKLAKETPRILLEKARSFVKDAQNARSKGRLFVWKLSELKKSRKVSTQEELSLRKSLMGKSPAKQE